MEYATYAKTVSMNVNASDQHVKDRIQAKMKKWTIEDVAGLHTMLERCSQSTNSQLQEDLEKKEIPLRIEYLAKRITESHSHAAVEDDGDFYYTTFQCIEDEHIWNPGFPEKAFTVIFGISAAILIYPAYLAIRMFYRSYVHAREVEAKLNFIVSEIESLYDETHTIMIANYV